MSWESILKGGREYQDFSKFFRDLYRVIKMIESARTSDNIKQQTLEPIMEMRSRMYDASVHGHGNYHEIKSELKNYLRQKVAPLNRNYAEALQRIV